MKRLFSILIMMLMATGGCKPDGHLPPFEVNLGHLGTVTGKQIDKSFNRFSLSVNVSSIAHVRNLVIQVNVPNGVEIENYTLVTREGDKTVISEKTTPNDASSITWTGEIHPKHTFWEGMFRHYHEDAKGLDIMLKTKRSDRIFEDNFKVNVSFEYYDDPNAGPDYLSSGSYNKSFEFGAEAWRR